MQQETLRPHEDCQMSTALRVGRRARRYFVTRMRISLLPLALCLVIASLTGARAQDPVLSQFYAAPMLLNPAFAGMTRAPSVTINHRSQNVGFAGSVPYQTSAVSYGQFVSSLNSGFGASLLADDAGDGIVRTLNATAYYAYQVAINKENVLRLGLSAGVQQRSLDWDRLIFFDQIDPNTGATDLGGNTNPTQEVRPDRTTILFPDFGAGVLYAGKLAYGGLTVDHLTTPDDRIVNRGPGGFYKGYPLRISLHGGAQIPLDGDVAKSKRFVTPNVLYTHQGAFDQLNLGAYVGIGQFFGGAWFRHGFGNGDAVIGTVGVEWGMYQFGYSYDATVSGLRQSSAGSHEISLQLNFEEAPWIQKRRQQNRYNDCLQLFR